MSRSTKMSAASQQIDFSAISEDYRPSSSEAHLAKTSAAPTRKAKASKASGVGSTSKQFVLSEKSALVGSLLRTALISELGALTPCSLHWKDSTTTAGRLWSVLRTSEPTTNAQDHGSSDAMSSKLPTPMASDGMKDGKGGGAGSPYPFRKILATPRKTDADRGFRGDVLSQLEGYPTKHAGMLSTPRASDMKAGGHGDTGRMGTVRHQLQKAMMPTPLASDRKGSLGRNSQGRVKSPNMPLAISGPTTLKSEEKWAYARQIASMLSSAGLTGPSMTLPITYGWMLGYPVGWLSNALLLAVQGGHLRLASLSKRTATASCHKSRKQSARQS